MTDQITTPEQQKVIDDVNRQLKSAGLPTYTEVESRGAMLGVAALESLDMGKQLIKQVKAMQKTIKKLRKEKP